MAILCVWKSRVYVDDLALVADCREAGNSKKLLIKLYCPGEAEDGARGCGGDSGVAKCASPPGPP